MAKERLTLGLDRPEQLAAAARALSSPVRLDILRRLVEQPMAVSELAEALYLPLSSAGMHVRMLEEAGLVSVTKKPGVRGFKKVCSIRRPQLLVDFFAHQRGEASLPPAVESIPIGSYTDCLVEPPCGIASEVSVLDSRDSPYGFYGSGRWTASLLWFTRGWLEYKLPNRALKEGRVRELELSFEICSEFPGNNSDWPSDITLSLNGRRVTDYLSRGDYGDRRGALNPQWWSDSMTQYGELLALSVTREGCFLNGGKVSGETLDSLGLSEGYCFRFRLEVEEDAAHAGGMNLFGSAFGDHPQDIVMRVSYQ